MKIHAFSDLHLARTRAAAQSLAEAFRARSTRKVYWALTKGVPRERRGRISTWLTKETGPDGDRLFYVLDEEDDPKLGFAQGHQWQ